MLQKLFVASLAALFLGFAPAHAAELEFSAVLDGRHEPTVTGSAATGVATVRVNTETHAIDLTMTIAGLTLDDLYDHVIHAGMGPVHLHLYAANGDISLLAPFPYGQTYTAAENGFTVAVSGYSYEEGARVLRSNVSFEDFLASLRSDFVYLNVHTDAFTGGEISGRIVPQS